MVRLDESVMGQSSHNIIRRSACPANARSSNTSLTFRPSPKSRKTLCAMAMTFSSRRSRPDGPLPAADHRRSPRSLAYPRMSRVQLRQDFSFGSVHSISTPTGIEMCSLLLSSVRARRAIIRASLLRRRPCRTVARRSRGLVHGRSHRSVRRHFWSSDHFQAMPSRFFDLVEAR